MPKKKRKTRRSKNNPFSREGWLLAHGVSAERWAKRYGIEPGSAPCYTCGRERVTSIPFAVDQLRGLVAPTCECGNDRGPYAVVVDPKFGFDMWDLLGGRWRK